MYLIFDFEFLFDKTVSEKRYETDCFSIVLCSYVNQKTKRRYVHGPFWQLYMKNNRSSHSISTDEFFAYFSNLQNERIT